MFFGKSRGVDGGEYVRLIGAINFKKYRKLELIGENWRIRFVDTLSITTDLLKMLMDIGSKKGTDSSDPDVSNKNIFFVNNGIEKCWNCVRIV